jgi:N-acylglucosamine-6-phosphate 2-epimerase
MSDALAQIRRGLIVSCQSSPGDPTDSPALMVAFARSAERGGAAGLRLNSPEHIRAVRAAVGLPVIGIQKRTGVDGGVLITGDPADARLLVEAGAEIVAFDATAARPTEPLKAVIEAVHAAGGLALADLRRFEDADRAAALGVDALATTLSVFDLPEYQPDIDLIRRLHVAYDLPVIAEGNFWDPDHVRGAFEAGAHSVVIGSAITRPWLITERFARAVPHE